MAASPSIGITAVIVDPTTPAQQAAVDANGNLKTVLAAGSAAVGTVSVTNQGGYNASATITRTADTNAYAAADVIGAATGSTAAIEFTSMGPSAGRISITGTILEVDASALIASEAGYTLHLYSVTPPSALGDNAPFDLPAGDRASYLGKLALGTPVDLGSTLWVEVNNIGKQVKLAGTSLFGYLVTDAGYTPTSARVYVVKLHAVAAGI